MIIGSRGDVLYGVHLESGQQVSPRAGQQAGRAAGSDAGLAQIDERRSWSDQACDAQRSPRQRAGVRPPE
jgi:hypothetical protein